MIIGFETGKRLNDKIVEGFVHHRDNAYFQTFDRSNVRDQYKDNLIFAKNPLPKDVDHKWQALDVDMKNNHATAFVWWGFLRSTKKLYRQALKRKIDFFFLDHSYFYHKIHHQKKSGIDLIKNPFVRVVKNGFVIDKIIDTDERGLKNLSQLGKEDFEVKKWKKTGSKIVVLPPSFHMCDFLDLKHEDVLNDMISNIKKHTDREIVIRYKKPDGIHNPKPIEEEIADAWAVVSFQSNAVVKFILNGVPSFTYMDKHSVACPVSLTDFSKIENPWYPDNRYEWLCNICNNQFQERFVYSGHVMDYLNRMVK